MPYLERRPNSYTLLLLARFQLGLQTFRSWPIELKPSILVALDACCDDGVVIVEDKVIYKPLVMEKDKISYAEKLRGVILNIIFGYSGEVKMYDLFVSMYLVGDVVILRDEQKHIPLRI
jgi:hypothetical protein